MATPTNQELFELIVALLDPLRVSVETEDGQRIYAAHTAARVGLGQNSGAERRLATARERLGL